MRIFEILHKNVGPALRSGWCNPEQEKHMTGRRILVIDDDKDLVDMICEILAIDDHTVEKVYNGMEAVDRVKNVQFDLVFLDIKLPETDGVQVLRRLKMICPGVKVVMMTGYHLDEESQKIIDEEGVEVIYKPFEMDKVLNLIKTYTLPDDE